MMYIESPSWKPMSELQNVTCRHEITQCYLLQVTPTGWPVLNSPTLER